MAIVQKRASSQYLIMVSLKKALSSKNIYASMVQY